MNKYKNKKVVYGGMSFDSQDEALYYLRLKKSKNVSQIHPQVRFMVIKPIYALYPKQLKTKVRYDKRLMLAGHRYTADFVFFEDDKMIICDVKSKYTAKLRDFNITMKIFVARILKHNAKRHTGQRKIVFRKAIREKGNWISIDYPIDGCFVM